MKGFHVFMVILLFKYTYSWDTDDLELFDLVEEINNNFYEEFGVKSDANVSEIKKSYRKLSLQYHPDKNKEPGAELKFRQLVSMYEVLKDENRRKKYDEVVEFGLPDWRQPVYYYRKVRKLGLLEMMIILFFIFTVGHFLVIWAAYFEKKFEVEEVFSSRKKKDKRGRKAKLQQAQQEEEFEQELQIMLESIPRPRASDLLPFKITKWMYHGILSIPGRIQEMKAERERRKRQQIKREEELRELEEEAKMEREKRPRRKRVQVMYETDGSNESTERPVSYTPVLSVEEEEGEQSQHNKTDEWSNEDYMLLAKAVAKYPGGSSKRWEKIATMLNRDTAEVITKSKEMKTDFNKPVDTAAQGMTGTIGEAVQIKKGKAISNDISKRSDYVEDVQATNHSTVNINKNHKPTKKNKTTAERNLTISNDTRNASSEEFNYKGTESKTSTDNKSDQCNISQTTNSKPATNEKRVTFSSETQSMSSEALSKSMKEKSGRLTVESSECIGAGSGSGTSNTEGWSQNQQKIFEWGLTQFTKGVEDRWDKIAQHIPGKSKEDCIVRFKYLADLVKKKKQMQKQQ